MPIFFQKFYDLICNLLLWFPLNFLKNCKISFFFISLSSFLLKQFGFKSSEHDIQDTIFLLKICFSITFWLLLKICTQYSVVYSGNAVGFILLIRQSVNPVQISFAIRCLFVAHLLYAYVKDYKTDPPKMYFL